MKIKEVDIDSIKDRVNPQREKPRGVEDLADSIKRIGLINPITLDDDGALIAGGNRIEAYKRLGYKTIPAVYQKDLSSLDKQLMELDENIRRVDLTWQEECHTLNDLNEILREAHPDWNKEQRANYAGYKGAHFGQLCKVARELIKKNELVMSAGNVTVAMNVIERSYRRKLDNESNELWDLLAEETKIKELENGSSSKGLTPAKKAKAKPKKKQEIINGDFCKWSEAYDGPKFNLIHCDFPYGIQHGKSEQGGAKTWRAYEDSPDDYWKLLRSLAANRDKLLYPSAHMIFWFSMRFYTETLEFFSKHMPEMEVDHQPLIWHKTDNKGIIRNAKHTPRNITETALFITRGNREIIKSVANCYGAPTQKSKATHISEKPVPVLRHFFQLCCDGYSEILDPTCGSGSALRAADSMGAKRVFGIELDKDYAEDAANQLSETRNMARFSNSLMEE